MGFGRTGTAAAFSNLVRCVPHHGKWDAYKSRNRLDLLMAIGENEG